MRIAIPSWQGRVSPVFDVAEDLTVVDLDADDRQVLRIPIQEARERVQYVCQLEVDLLICGAISRHLEAAFHAAGIDVLPHICGDLEEVLAAYSRGDLVQDHFHMPGCGRRRQRRRCHHRRPR